MMAGPRPGKGPIPWYQHLDRALSRPELVGIGISGCVGVGIFVNSGALIAITGSLGAVICYILAGGTVACVLYSLTEMVTCRPLTGALIEVSDTFLDPAAGFALGTSYALANICSMATLTAQSSELTALLKDETHPKRHNIETEIGINVFFIALTTISHCLGVKIYGKIERVIMWFKLSLFVLVCILMLVINVRGSGRKEGSSYSDNYSIYGFAPGWKPTGYDSTMSRILRSTGVHDNDFGIDGAAGRLFAFLTAASIAMFSCMGGEIMAMTAGEAKNYWKDTPAAMSFVYMVPLSIYPFAMLAAGSNVNFANPDLAKLWSKGSSTIPKSPFVIAVESAAIGGLPTALNLFFIISAYTAANTALYVASRAVFMVSQMYLPGCIANTLGRTNKGHTPLWAILFCSALGFLSLAGLSEYAYSQPRITLSELYTGSVACCYICICVTFLRFKAGLDRLGKRGLIERDDDLYISRLFKSRWQPLPAYIGIFGCSFVVLWSGVAPLYILICRGMLLSSNSLKSKAALAFDVIGAYIGPILFGTFYLVYKYITPRSFVRDIRDLTTGHYVLEDLETNVEQENPNTTPPRKSSDALSPEPGAVEMDAGLGASNGTAGNGGLPGHDEEYDMSPDMQDQIEAENARIEERDRVLGILENRPERMGRGVRREIWSFVVAE